MYQQFASPKSPAASSVGLPDPAGDFPSRPSFTERSPFSRPACFREALLYMKDHQHEKVEIRAWFAEDRLVISRFSKRFLEHTDTTLCLESAQVEQLMILLGLPGNQESALLLALQHYFSRDYFDAFRTLLEENGVFYGLIRNP